MSTDDPWGADSLRQTLETFVGVGADAGLPDEVRFVRSVLRIIERRRGSGSETSPGFAYFLLSPPDEVDVDDAAVERVFRLDLGEHELVQHVWVVNHLANDGAAIRIEPGEDHTDVAAKVKADLRLGGVPAISLVVSSDAVELHLFPGGLAAPGEMQALTYSPSDVSSEAITAAIAGVHKSSMVTPLVQNRASKLWSNADKYWVESDAEDEVQSVIQAGLAAHFHWCEIRAEQPQPEGRHDLLIEEYRNENGRVVCLPHAMVELKVLRSLNVNGNKVSATYTDDWVESGVKQAHAYALGRRSYHSLLACFDARTEDEATDACFSRIADLARDLNVEVRSWRLYGSVDDYRNAIAGGGVGV